MVFEAESLQGYLRAELERRVRVNPRYSLRAFAGALGLSSGALSEILRERRPVSLKLAKKIARALELNSIETRRLFDLVQKDRQRGMVALEAAPLKSSKQLDLDTFELLSAWHHFAILNLLDCHDVEWNPAYIAKRLGLTQTQARLSMDLLARVGLIEVRSGRAKASQETVLSPTGASSAAIRNYHRQILLKAIEALELQKPEEREMAGVGFAVDAKRIPQLKIEINKFLDEITTKYSNGKMSDVYFFETALFRLTGRSAR